MVTEKAYLLCILYILEKYSDSDNILTMKDIRSKLESIYDVHIDRRTVYRNIDVLIEFGYDISIYEDNQTGYFLREREFESCELHMLADAIFSAEFIPEKDGKSLIRKLQKLGSNNQTKSLGRLACVKSNKKTSNMEIFYNIEMLDYAIQNNKQIEFDYITYDLNLKQIPRRSEKYIINPYLLYWGNGQYYLISNMIPYKDLCHFRLDRIKNIQVVHKASLPLDPSVDLFSYAKNSLFMYGGDTETFTIICDKIILNDVVDQFGDQIFISDSDEFTFTCIVKATTGGMRLFAIHYFETCRVISPTWLLEEVKRAIKKGVKLYEIENID